MAFDRACDGSFSNYCEDTKFGNELIEWLHKQRESITTRAANEHELKTLKRRLGNQIRGLARGKYRESIAPASSICIELKESLNKARICPADHLIFVQSKMR